MCGEREQKEDWSLLSFAPSQDQRHRRFLGNEWDAANLDRASLGRPWAAPVF